MPTKHPRHIVTEVGPVADAFARARRIKPDVHVRDLVLLGAEAMVEREMQAEVDEERRAAAIERLISLTTEGEGIDSEAAEYVHEVLGVPELSGVTPSFGAPRERVLVDNSVWSRVRRPDVGAVWRRELSKRTLIACPPFMIEAGYSARTPDELHRIRVDISESMDSVCCDERTWELALEAQQAMADAAGLMHRRRPLDFLIAATAHQHGLGVLHYDRDYDLIAEHGRLDFASVWVVPPGSLER